LEIFKKLFKKPPRQWGLDIQVDLLGRICFAKCRPYLFFLAILPDLEGRIGLRTAQKHLINISLYRFAVLPNLVESQKEIGILRVAPLGEEVLKIGRLP